MNADGTAQFADAITLDKDLSEGIALGFSTRLSGDVKIAAARTERQSADVTELDRVIYTPCQVCAENGQTNPTWSIRARKIIEDHKRQKTLYFQDAVIQVKGVGVLYLPAFWTADPSADRKSGLPAAAGHRLRRSRLQLRAALLPGDLPVAGHHHHAADQQPGQSVPERRLAGEVLFRIGRCPRRLYL